MHHPFYPKKSINKIPQHDYFQTIKEDMINHFFIIFSQIVSIWNCPSPPFKLVQCPKILTQRASHANKLTLTQTQGLKILPPSKNESLNVLIFYIQIFKNQSTNIWSLSLNSKRIEKHSPPPPDYLLPLTT